MHSIEQARQEVIDTANQLADTIRESLIERHVAATLAAATITESFSAQAAVNRYREVLAELRNPDAR